MGALVITSHTHLQAQKFHFSGGVGLNLESSYGFEANVDNIVVQAIPFMGKNFIGKSNGGGDPNVSTFLKVSSAIDNRIALSLSLEYVKYHGLFLAFDADQIDPVFGPEFKSGGVSNPVLNTSFRGNVKIAHFNKLKFNVLFGITFQSKLKNNQEDIDALNPINEKVFNVLNGLDDSIKGLQVLYDYGLSFSYGKIGLDVFYQKPFSNSYTGPIKFEGESFEFINKRDFINIQISYTFLKFGR